MTYEQALAASHGNVAACTGDAALASTCLAVSLAHAVNPKMLYDGAKKLKLTERHVRKALNNPGRDLTNIMFAA